MDFDIGNIFYIVITLVVVIVGLLGKKKKPAQGGTGEQGSEPRPGFMENLERVLQMGQEESLVADQEPFEEDLPVEETAQVQVAEPVSNVRESMTESPEVVDLDHIPGTDYFEIIKDFDAGTAVVYSAIINRLDY